MLFRSMKNQALGLPVIFETDTLTDILIKFFDSQRETIDDYRKITKQPLQVTISLIFYHNNFRLYMEMPEIEIAMENTDIMKWFEEKALKNLLERLQEYQNPITIESLQINCKIVDN